jgi:hypothetical protein
MPRTIGRTVSAGASIPDDTDNGAGDAGGSEKPSPGNQEFEREDGRIAGFPTVSPFDVTTGGVGDAASGESPKRRGRPPGSGRKQREAQVPQNIVRDLESLLLGVFQMGAAFFKVKELELDKSEAERLSASIENFAKHYSVNIDPKKLAAFELTTTGISIFGPRLYVIWKQRPERNPEPERVPKQQQKTANVQSMNDTIRRAQAPSELWQEAGNLNGEL